MGDDEVLTPAMVTAYAAAWMLRTYPDLTRRLRTAAQQHRLRRFDAEALQLEEARVLLMRSAGEFRRVTQAGASARGSAEASESEIGASSEASNPPRTATTAESATLLGVTERRVRQFIADEKLLADRRGRDWVVDRDSLDALLAQRRRSR